jgi:hypothetical protein
MAIFDAMFEFSDNQLITGDAQSTNVLDMQAPTGTYKALNMGAGTPMWLNVRVSDADFAGGTSLIVKLYAHTAATSIESGTLLYQTADIAQASLTTGAWIIRMPLPENFDILRYVGLYYDDTGAFSSGGIDAWLDNGSQSSYDKQVSVSNI